MISFPKKESIMSLNVSYDQILLLSYLQTKFYIYHIYINKVLLSYLLWCMNFQEPITSIEWKHTYNMRNIRFKSNCVYKILMSGKPSFTNNRFKPYRKSILFADYLHGGGINWHFVKLSCTVSITKFIFRILCANIFI